MSRLAYTLATAATETGLSAKTLDRAIKSGRLKARRSSENEDGDPTGRYVILHADLVAFLEGLTAA